MQNSFIKLKLIYLSLVGLSVLSSCQRAQYAYFQPTAKPVYAAESPVSAPAPLLASADEALPPVATPTEPAPVVVETAALVLAAPATAQPARSYRPQRGLLSRLGFSRSLPPACDQIVLRNGDVIDAKVKEVGVNEIRYKKCDRQDGPDYTILKRDVLSIRYSNGEVERFSASVGNAPGNSTSTSAPNRNRSYNSPTSSGEGGPRTDPFAIVALSAGAVGFLFGGILLGAAAIVFGAISFSRIRKQPERFKGKALAVAGFAAGIVAIALAIFVWPYVVLN